MQWYGFLSLPIGLAAAFAAGQGTVVGPNQKYWLIGAWLVGLPTSALLMILGAR